MSIGDLRFHRNRALVIGAAGKTREALLPKQDGKGVDADGVTGGSEFPLHVIDREIAFAHGYRQLPNAVAGRGGLRPALRLAKEGSALLGIVAELMAEDAEGARGVTGNDGRLRPRALHRRGRHGGLRTGAAWGTAAKGKNFWLPGAVI
jgi:hypothetical protein